MKRIFLICSSALLGLLCLANSARSADRYSMINVHPNQDVGHYLFMQEAQTLPKFGFSFGTTALYYDDLLEIKNVTVVTQPGGRTVTTETHDGIGDLIYQYFYGAFGITDRISVMFDFPLFWAYKYGWTTATSTTNSWFYAKPGDLWLYGKFNLYDIKKHRLGIAFIPAISVPSGKQDHFLGDEGVTAEGRIVIEAKPVDSVRVAFNAAFQTRERVTVNDITFRDKIKLALGVNYEPFKDVSLIAEAEAQTATNNFFGERRTSPAEARFGARWHPGDMGLNVGGGGSVGIVHGTGMPRFAVFAGVGYTGQIRKKEVKVSRLASLDDEAQCTRVSADDGSGRYVFVCNTYFDFNRSENADTEVVGKIADAIKKSKDAFVVEIRGWADQSGSKEYNDELSLRRACFIESKLKDILGPDAGRVSIHVLGVGEDKVSSPDKARRTDSLIR